MQPAKITVLPPVGVVYDSNLGQGIDSILALALLHGFAGKQKCRVASLTVNYPDLRAAQLCDAIERFYASAITGPAAEFFRPSPLGIVEGKNPAANLPVLAKTWPSGIKKWNDTAIPELLIRNELMANYDGNAVMVLSGPATNLASLLKLYDIQSLIAAKVRMLAIAEGEFTADLPAARRVLAEWPTPIVFCSREVGAQLPFPGASIDSAFSYNATHPIAEAYRVAGTMPYDAPAPALAAMLYALNPAEGYFALSEPGTVSVGNDGRTVFQPSAQGRHRYLKADPAQRERIMKVYVEMASAKPVAPPPRRLPPPVQAQKAAEKKPAPALVDPDAQQQ
ncbi:MAG: hypothetical protein ABSB15_00580 [Bryobacteraceae bacterium]|jgi:hypothetical protein